MQGSKDCVCHHVGDLPVVIARIAALIDPVHCKVQEVLGTTISKKQPLVSQCCMCVPSWDFLCVSLAGCVFHCVE
jgi:hypothetical protein